MTSISCKGSADEEHTQYMAGLETALAERVQQFDDLESDDVRIVYFMKFCILF